VVKTDQNSGNREDLQREHHFFDQTGLGNDHGRR
jgi:hypothetical protein